MIAASSFEQRAKCTSTFKNIFIHFVFYFIHSIILSFIYSFQRVALFSAYAMSAMCQAGFDVIDVYPMTDSYPSGTDDVVHYPNHVFNSVETLLERYKAHNNKKLGENENKARIKRCIA